MRFKNFMLEQGLYLSWGIALIAVLGSLYFSEVLGYFPCKLCWYQRILMYPQVILTGIAAVRKDYSQTLYVLPMTVLGAAVSTYHYLLEKTSLFHESGTTCGPIPCTAEYINWFGFVTIPFLALVAFVLISVLQIMVRLAAKHR